MRQLWRALSLRAWAWVAVGAVALLVTVSGLSFWKGYDWRDTQAQADQAAALLAQKKELQESHDREIAALAKRSAAEHAAKEIRDAPRPADPGCDAGTEWLQHLQGAVRRANGIAGAD